MTRSCNASLHEVAERGPHGARRRGFALLEVLAATAIVLVLVGSLLMILLPSQGGFRTQPAAIDVQQRLRIAADAIHRDILGAGSGPLNPLLGLPLGAVVPSVLPYRVGLRRGDPPGTCRDDLITLVTSVPGAAAATISTDFQGSAGAVGLLGVPGCAAGDMTCGLQPEMSVLMLDANGQWDLYGVAAALGDTVTLEARGASSGRRYLVGARLVPVDLATYYLRASAGPDGPQLMRYDANRSDLPQVDHIVVLSVEYYGESQPPRLRDPPGPLGQRMTYGPTPPGVGEDDIRDSWGPGENCVIALEAGRQVPRLAVLHARAALLPLDAAVLADGPWCPDAAAANRFDADLLRIRKVRVRLRAEAWSDMVRGADSRFFRRPGLATSGMALVPDQEINFEGVPRTLGGGR
jgi:type II secretory pathway pseudopilin PulG